MKIMAKCYNAYIAKNVSPKSLTNNLVIGFTRQLKQRWFNYLIQEERDKVMDVVNEKGQSYSLATLVFKDLNME